MIEGYSRRFWILVSMGIVAVVLGAAVWVAHDRATNAESTPAMTAAERAYCSQIQIANPRMSVATNFMGDTLYYLDADATNKGSKTIRRLELQMEFLDPFRQVVLRDTQNVISAADRPLEPGKTRHLHITFEHLPAEWNQGPPDITAKRVNF
jgi:hypothetical protein